MTTVLSLFLHSFEVTPEICGRCYGAFVQREMVPIALPWVCIVGWGIVLASERTHFISTLEIRAPFIRYRSGQVRGSGVLRTHPLCLDAFSSSTPEETVAGVASVFENKT